MENPEVNKTSDEIINELFSSLNVPLSPKVVEERGTVKGEQASAHTGDSDNSEDDESDSKSSESEGESKGTVDDLLSARTEKNEKLKSQKKKKDKRKKKKKHRKKEDGGRHKHKKKKKKDSFETAEEAKLAADVLQDVKLKNQALIQKIFIREEVTEGVIDNKENEERRSGCKSPELRDAQSEAEILDCKKKPEESHSSLKGGPPEEASVLLKEGTANLPSHLEVVLESCKNSNDVPASMLEESASKSDMQPCTTYSRSPGAECVSNSSRASPSIAVEHKRKQSPHSCSPQPVKKLKSSDSVSPPKSSSPKAASTRRSPTYIERSRSQSAKDTKSESCRTKSRSPLEKQSKSQSARSESKSGRSRSRSRKRSESKKRSTSKSRKKSESKSKRRSRSRSKKRSRSRSRSRRRSSSRSRRKVRSSSKKRSRSRSRKGSKSKRRSVSKSRVRSRSKSRKRSRSKSRKRSGSKSRRKSASKSKRSRSRDKSRSVSRKVSGSKGRRSRSKSKNRSRSRSRSRQRSSSKSGKRSRSRLRRRSRSRRKSGSQSHRRSRSKSGPKSSPSKERFDMFAVMRERANRLAELKIQGVPDGSLGSLLLSAAASVQSVGCAGVSQSSSTPESKSTSLPHKGSLPSDSQAKEEVVEKGTAVGEEDKAAAVTEDTEQDSSKSKDGNKNKQEEGNEKSKTKTIITIKSLKDSIVFQQAQEEAERKAKEKVDQPAGTEESSSAVDSKDRTEEEQEDEAKLENASHEEKKKNSDKEDRRESEADVVKEDEKDEEEERGQDEEKQMGEESHAEGIDTEVVEKSGNEREKDVQEKVKEGNEDEMEIDTTASRKDDVDMTEEMSDSKENKHSSKGEEEERKGSKQLNKGEEEDGHEVMSDSEGSDTGNKQSSSPEEEEDKKLESSSKDEVEESEGHAQLRKVSAEEEEEEEEEEEYSESKQPGKAEGVEEEEEEEEEDKADDLCVEREKEKGKKHSSKEEEKDDGKLGKESKKMEEDESKGSKPSSKAEEEEKEEEEEEEEGVKSQPSSKIEDEEDGKGNKDESGKNGHIQADQESADKIEEGEIVSDKEEVVTKPSSKSHSKKSKKDKSSAKEKKRSHKDKSKNKEEKKKAHDKKKEHDKARSRSKERHKSRQHSSSGAKDHSHSRRHRRHSRSRSRSRDHSSRQHRRSHSRSRSKSRSKRRHESTSDLRDKVTRKRLLEIARRNAVYLMQNGCLPPSVEKEQLVKIKAGGKSVDELTDFCKQLVASGNYSDVDVSEPSMSSEEENNSEKPFSSARHPFSVRDSKPILMNIRNAPMLPTKTNAERLAGQAKLREQFPVSSGSQHRTKESEWVPVTPKEKKEEDKVFTKPEAPPVDISQIVSTRLSAMRKLQDNPNDSEAIKTLNNVQKEMQNWALSKQEPGQFTGTTGVKVLSQEELSSGHQAWARKEQFKEAAPVRPQFGLKMLQKMGWSPGEGLGKNKEGTTEPLLLDVKMDKKGFHAQEEVTPKKQPIPLVKDLSGGQQCKHPVSALVELCSKRKWSPPDFEMVFDCGPDHKKNFLMKVMVNGQEFKPSVAASTKKMAKANAAAAYLQSLGLYPKDPRYPL